MLVDEDFLPSLAGFDLVALDRVGSTAYGIRADGRIAYVNDAWHEFARANGADWSPGRWDLGVQIADVVPPELRPFYDQLFARARSTANPCDHTYECSTPTRLRRFRMRIYPLSASFLVVNHFVEERDPGLSMEPDEARYVQAGVIVMCMHCRRTRRAGTDDWDWVSEYVAHEPPNTSHGLCRPCFGYHYGRIE